MVKLSFKILIFFGILIILSNLIPLDKVEAADYVGGCSPKTCNCHNIFGMIGCEAECPPGAENCATRCICGFAQKSCTLVWCPYTSYCYSGQLYYNPYCSSFDPESGSISCPWGSTEPCYDRWYQDRYGDYYYRCSGSYLQRYYVEAYCSGTVNGRCITDSDWKNYKYCGSGTSCGGNYCYNNDVYQTCTSDSCKTWNWNGRAYTSGKCDSDSEYVRVDECGTSGWTDEYQCNGGVLQRKWINRGCAGAKCYTSVEWKEYQDCGDSSYTGNYRCDGDIIQREYVERGCVAGSCYDDVSWVDEEDCGSDSCDAWGSNYCLNDDVYRSRTCYERGCAENSCYKIPSTQEELVQDCGADEWLDEYRCSGNWSQQKILSNTCSGGSCDTVEEWVNNLNCAETCFPKALNAGCRGGTYTCNISTGKCGTPLQPCSPEEYTASGVVCSCNNEKGAAIKNCNGTGGCLEVDPYCDESCGADPACQGLKPGDPYPGDNTKVCCKGEEAELHLPSWYEIAP